MKAKTPSEALTAHAKGRTQAVVAKLQAAMKEIKIEIESQDGIYPLNSGRLSRAEVCRRAGVASAVLEGKAHKTTTLVNLNRWLTEVRQCLIVGHKAVRQTVTRRAEEGRTRAKQFATQTHLYHLQMVSLEHRLQEAQARIALLESENEQLRIEASGARVVLLGAKRR
ncbi:hypothetical protein IHE49_15340 [Rhodanobacter sp. 7MK24]|uniref:hypothetical protein n=1 Tax=Rhodanobacter sp. 7MK24 TaxID=2775922 RepID=UPI00177BB427|nr:hypothetical protein [Rhodanobacter sp. 7MK24]MBD8881860.1 hypothetical protein [Rhodanobacter sp. 7MK24]